MHQASLFPLFVLPSLVCCQLLAQDATVIPFQGQLANQVGQPLSPTNAVTLVFRLYTAPVAGTAIWEESQPNISVSAGRFSVLLGSRTQLPAQSYFNSTLYLGITVDDGNPQTADVEMRPRQALVPVISARYAQNADKLRGYDWTVLFGTNNPVDGKLQGSKIADGAIQDRHIGILSHLSASDGTPANAVVVNEQGDTSVNGKLHVAGDVVTGHDRNFIAQYGLVGSSNDWSGSLDWSSLQLGNNGANFVIAGRSSRGGSLIFVTDNTSSFDYHLVPHNGKEVMTLTESGNVGIGTRSPQATLDVRGTVKAFGAWQARAADTVYQAPTDGFVIVTLRADRGNGTEVIGYTDGANPPTTRRGCASGDYLDTGAVYGSFNMPVRKGDYYRIVNSGGAVDLTFDWLPLGQ